ncbi:MAG: tRNA (adenosine(37)-N6)-threonylcarbamoyltransferase complex ATPase subunit type 1 TsaE [Parcubacteria group bacterium]|nr:tRNA (adenosine(37)-N6)-threonylcarbamoyltransferase complex ATPase subunit type 1 TsaE [Parcubacteria group bacterium]
MDFKGVEKTNKEAKDFVSALSPKDEATVVALYGDLGSGKTTFVKAVAGELGVEQTVTSPTFVLEKIYKLEGKRFEHLIHIDAYRLDSKEELLALGWDSIVRNPKNLIFVEWADKVEEIIPESAKRLTFENVDEDTRRITHGEKN